MRRIALGLPLLILAPVATADPVAIVEDISASSSSVEFMDYELGYFDEESSNFEPLENPFGTPREKVLTMSPV